jgi:Cytochrome b(C-terminal)/b6/petD
MFDPHPDLTEEVVFGLGWIYTILFAANVWWTYRCVKRGGHVRIGGQSVPVAAFWALYAGVLLMVAAAHFTGWRNPDRFNIRLPLWFKDSVDQLLQSPVTYFVISAGVFFLMIYFRRWFVKPASAWILLNVALVFMALSMTDYDFRQIVGKPDNVPIVSMLFIVAFLTWLFFRRAVENDDRLAQGRPLLEQEDNDKVLVWPDLVYTELICMVVLTVILVVWGIVLQAPLEEPANAARTPNPSKAPWYFLGLQEMLVYYDPWLAGVVFPSLIVVGLMAIPYLDFNKKGNGYFCFNDRKFAIIVFQFGFLPLWIAMIILGTFLRGPNWGFFGIYEYWDMHKLEVLNNVYLSDWFWDELLGIGVMKAPADAGTWTKTGYILLRESPGFILILAYLFVLPPLMAKTIFKKFYERMGFIRYMVFSNLVLFMAALPIKMVLRWTFNLKYLVKIPEWFFNI